MYFITFSDSIAEGMAYYLLHKQWIVQLIYSWDDSDNDYVDDILFWLKE